MKPKAFLLSALCILSASALPALAQKPNARYDALRYWEFDFKGMEGSVPCRYITQTDELFLNGFDVEKDSVFYFAGGDPLSVSCFKGNRQLWRRQVSDTYATRGLFKLRSNDSIYLVNDRTRELIVLHKSGKGTVRHIKLPISQVYEGVMKDEDFILTKQMPMLHWGDTVYWARELYYFNYTPKLVRTQKTGKDYIHLLYANPCPHLPANNAYTYKGMYNGYQVFADPSGSSQWSMYFAKPGTTDSRSDRIYRMHEVNYWDLFPVPVLANEIDSEVHTPSADFEFIRGNHYFAIGFRWKDGKLIVSDVNLEKALKESQRVSQPVSSGSGK